MGGEVLWVLECLPEIESDMSVLHRVEDIYVMRADLLMRRVAHLPAYEGALRARLRRVQRQDVDQPSLPSPVLQEPDEEALWAAHRQRAYAKFLAPGEVPRQVSPQEGLALASRAFQGVR